MDLTFEMSKPFLPFEQLLAVLPAASKALLPAPFQWLMMANESPIIDFYPVDFEQDLNGKQQDWEAVVLIHLIDESRLLTAMNTLYPRLSKGDVSSGPLVRPNRNQDSHKNGQKSGQIGTF
jgi:5'-3' exoribonuclease 1